MNVFMGEEFTSQEDLRRVYPAFAGDYAWRAIKHGCTTPQEVEVFVFRKRSKGRAASLKAARANTAMKGAAIAKAQKQRKAGSQKGGATVRRRSAS